VTLVFDLESDGLLDKLTKIHCLSIVDLDAEESKATLYHEPREIEHALQLLQEAKTIIGHNIICFDIPAIQKVYPEFKPTGQVRDTLVLSRLIKADLFNDDFKNQSLPDDFLKRFYGSHSLKAWGMRLSNLKDDYDGGWENYSDAMGTYCNQDAQLTADLYKHLSKEDFSETSIELEHNLAAVCHEVGNNGWTFDLVKAGELYGKLSQRRADLNKELSELFEPWEIHTEFIPKVNNKTLGYVKGEPFTKVKVVEFNPNSRKHIHYCLVKKYNWKPTQFSPSGDPKLDESTLEKLPYPEAKKLAESFMIQKRIAMLAEGRSAWLKLCDNDGKLRHTIIPNGCVSGRASHRNPNLGQVTSARLPYGKECRELFTVPTGWTLLGSDLSGLEVRLLAHFLHHYDNGEYAKQILEGDIHTYNANALGIERSQAKTWLYATMYGGGNKIIGEIVGGSAKDGSRLKKQYDQNVPAFKRLREEVRRAAKRGYIFGLDRRKLYIRSEHKALSQLLQSAGAVLCKQWLYLVYKQIKQQLNNDAYIVGWIHDEIQIACKSEGVAERVGQISKEMGLLAGNTYNLQIPLESEYSLGSTWHQTH
jgi:DNA polymerase I-like protein with 3'-5' exonuclease and polymerase domains